MSFHYSTLPLQTLNPFGLLRLPLLFPFLCALLCSLSLCLAISCPPHPLSPHTIFFVPSSYLLVPLCTLILAFLLLSHIHITISSIILLICFLLVQKPLFKSPPHLSHCSIHVFPLHINPVRFCILASLPLCLGPRPVPSTPPLQCTSSLSLMIHY